MKGRNLRSVKYRKATIFRRNRNNKSRIAEPAAEQEEVCTILSRFNGNVKKQCPLRISDIGSDWKIMC